MSEAREQLSDIMHDVVRWPKICPLHQHNYHGGQMYCRHPMPDVQNPKRLCGRRLVKP